MGKKYFFTALFVFLTVQSAYAEPCETEDFETKVTGVSQCLLIRRYGPTEPAAMVVWIHGDVSSGGPANYHFRLAEKTAEDFSASSVMSVALVRPGYPDGSGASSTVSFLHGGRSDHYTPENISEVAAVIEKLRLKYQPKSVIIVGHSGGAATAAVILGMKPNLADAAVLVSCPCDLVSWRIGRRPWVRSENPTQWVNKISASTRVIALTGTKDDNTSPNLASTYVDLLKSRGINATFQAVAEATHNSALRSAEVFDAIAELLHR
ncbi:Prolyl oligopeptidase family protein [Tepidimonas thermarum]|uniref:Prolyl oligopeptidase family protein n=1 Tax=Tepidimonas thermarum TaxID=335431 RepID=A0A554X202_9BURK|nr:alpha/beta hydrolase [Tepidimonas thermarum]TSE29871.1 Prolyl oligopeptidase family protein [Tepidimonas thermarum]